MEESRPWQERNTKKRRRLTEFDTGGGQDRNNTGERHCSLPAPAFADIYQDHLSATSTVGFLSIVTKPEHNLVLIRLLI